MSSVGIMVSVKRYLSSQFMFVDDEWLMGCVEFLTEDPSNNYSEAQIQELAKEQWLLNDLKEICPGSLPANLKSQHKTTLNGRFVLQVNAVFDIGTPAYQQYMKLQKINQENVEATTKFDDKVPCHRMIKLYLTDGVQDVSAIEYRPMRNLSCDIAPGCKMLLKGPVECRRGILLLQEAHVELLGGEVQELADANSLPGLLTAKLGVTVVPTDQNQPRNINVPTPHIQMPPPRELDHSDHTSKPVARVTSLQISSFNDDDADIDIDQIAALEAQIDSQKENFAHNVIEDTRADGTSKRTSTEDRGNPEKRMKIAQNTADDYPDDIEVFEDYDYLNEMEAKFNATESVIQRKNVSAEPYVYIKQINDLDESERAGRVFRVKGQIMKLLSKLSVGKDGWSLKCAIVDGTGSIEVDFTSTVLSKLVGYTPQEMNRLKKEMASRPELKEKAVSALQNAKESLQVLCCIIELTMLDVPKITGLTPFSEYHVDLLRKRNKAR